MNERVKAAFLTIAIVAAAASLILAAQAFRPQPPALSTGIPLSIVVEGPGWTLTYENDASLNNTVFAFLLEAARTLHFSLAWSNWTPPYSAVFVDAINGAVNGDGGRWWVFWVDREYGTLAADLTVLRGGEEIVWRFVTQQGG